MLHARSFAAPGVCDLHHFDGKKLPFFPKESFDAVMSVWTIQYLIDDSRFYDIISQLAACVKSGGKIYLLEQVRLQKGAWQRRAEEYISAFARCGCSCLESYPIRNSRSLLLYGIRYGLVPRRWLPALAKREIDRTRHGKPARWVRYQDYFFVFGK